MKKIFDFVLIEDDVELNDFWMNWILSTLGARLKQVYHSRHLMFRRYLYRTQIL